jgi:Tol biopolymer transport system component
MRDGGGLLMSAADVSSNYSFQLWYVSRAGGEAQRVTNDLSNYSGVSLTADSRALLTVQREGASNLWIAPGGDANRARQITSGKSDGYTGVAGTSDNRIVHSTLDWDIWIAGGDGSNPKLLSVNEHNNRHVSVSPDNRYVVFESWRGGSSPSRLGGVWRMDLDGGNAKQLASVAGANLHPQISPDGKWVVYDSGASGKNTLWKVSIDGGEPTRLTDEFSSLPTVSPDGKMVAGVFRRDLKAFKLALVPFEGGQPTKEYDLPPLANLQENGVRQLRWSPDGRALHFIVNSGGVSNLWSQPVDGGAPRQITDFKSDLIFAFDWSRDGRQLVLSRGTVTRDAVLIANFK